MAGRTGRRDRVCVVRGYRADVDEQRRGIAYGAAAYVLWGLFPLYWPLLQPAAAVEILAHRVLWSLLVVVALLAVRRQVRQAVRIRRRQLALLAVAGVLIAVNWGAYIYGVNAGLVVETSLGYFITPLVTVALGVVVLRERLRPAQCAAMAVAAVAVLVIALDYGRPPWIALIIACSFGTYGLLKKQAGVGALTSVTVETAVLALPALAFVTALAGQGEATFGTAGAGHALLLASSGIVTVVPLLCFSAAATRVPLTAMGLLQYLAPVLQFLIGVLVYREVMPTSRWMGFALVWVALALLTADAVRTSRRRSGSFAPPTPAAVPVSAADP